MGKLWWINDCSQILNRSRILNFEGEPDPDPDSKILEQERSSAAVWKITTATSGLHIRVVPDFWSPIRQVYEIFLDPEPDWILFLLKQDPDYPKNLEHFQIFSRFVLSCEKFLITWEIWCWMMWFMLFRNLLRMVDFTVHIAVVRWRESLSRTNLNRLCLLPCPARK